MAFQYITYEAKDHIATITLNRPDIMNAVKPAVLEELAEASSVANKDLAVRVILFTGAGRAFSAGADMDYLKESMAELKAKGKAFAVEQAAAHDDVTSAFAISLRQISKPILCAVNGAAVGFGFTLALACDIRIASDKAQLGGVFLRVGLTPEFGSTYNLVRLVGLAKACELVFTAKIVTAQEALQIGLVNQVVPHDQLMPATVEMARTIASLPPISMKFAKQNLVNGFDGSLAAQIAAENAANRICRDTEDYAEGVNSFLEKRKPVFKGR